MSDIRGALDRVAEHETSYSRGSLEKRLRTRSRSRYLAMTGTCVLAVSIVGATLLATTQDRPDSNLYTTGSVALHPPSSGDQAGEAQAGDLLFLDGGQLTVLDPQSGEVSPLGPQLSMMDQCGACNMVPFAGGAVMSNGAEVLALLPPFDEVVSLGAGGPVALSSESDVWIVDASDSTIRRVAPMDGTIVFGPVEIPAGLWPAWEYGALTYDVGGALVMTDGEGLVVWDPYNSEVLTEFPGDSLVAVGQSGDSSILVTIPVECVVPQEDSCALRVADAFSHEILLTVEAPLEARGFSPGGALSPDGAYLAAFVRPAEVGTQPRSQLVVIDMSHGTGSLVSGAVINSAASSPPVIWAADSSTIYFGPNRSYSVESEDVLELSADVWYAVVANPQ